MKPPIWETVYYDIPVYWMLMSFMTLGPKEQLLYFEYPPLHIGDRDYHRPTKNILMALTLSLSVYSFESDFDGDLEESLFVKNQWFHDLVNRQKEDVVYSYEGFMVSSYWVDLRKGAKELLDLSDLGFYTDIPKPIEFDYLVELVDSNED